MEIGTQFLLFLELTLDDFNEHAVILNIIKCSTKDIREISKNDIKTAKANCIGYLTRQLETMQPKVILSHSRFACETTIEFLKNGTTYRIDVASRDVGTLARKMREGKPIMDEISKEYVIAKNGSGHRILFLFNKHLSRYGPAMKSLNKNMEEKRRIIDDLL